MLKSRTKKILFISGLILLAAVTLANIGAEKIPTAQQVDLTKYLGTWHEIARKPLFFQKKCDYNVTAHYSLNEQGNLKVDNQCWDQNHNLQQSIGEAFVKNAPENTKLTVSFLPNAIRWLPVARSDYWILKIDQNYQVVLVGSPNKKYLWILSRSPKIEQTVLDEYLNYAKSLGFDLSDLTYTVHKSKE
ncbi:lipocalin family protein [Acinetobacter sp. R933-2]|uniref:lipocalin family protein n=1 Tax=Acinetobacter sp. R933-2 TaxID=2746728 RepID=UPI0025780B33|nr:lipocalin family protein [Acinetobacter sp. R933-2]MDM1248512.1 lipocalin family protein [Acinetobacter sp. R933-2]